jgi:N-[(2S)-2-amino-2-carboxyethyl]-L-glutamate dehydrogenase
VKYINEQTLLELGIDWPSLITVIEDATMLLDKKQFSQPVKPYLRFNNPVNRIIAMPAYIGGGFNAAGIKWIASFPGNIQQGIKRAHSVIILNNAETGVPTTIINTPLISGIRTASVSGFVLRKYLQQNNPPALTCGITGFGPIGQLHLQMLMQAYGDKIKRFFIYDINPVTDDMIKPYRDLGAAITVCSNWQEMFEQVNLFVTCTVSKDRYVDRLPVKGGIYLNVSLRDFKTDFLKAVDVNVVDNWDEICRENTDIENAHLEFGLSRADVMEIQEILALDVLKGLEEKSFMFNPMGMGIYDIAVARYYEMLAVSRNHYTALQD